MTIKRERFSQFSRMELFLLILLLSHNKYEEVVCGHGTHLTNLELNGAKKLYHEATVAKESNNRFSAFSENELIILKKILEANSHSTQFCPHLSTFSMSDRHIIEKLLSEVCDDYRI